MILAIDLGKKTTGVAISSGTIATPHSTVKHKNIKEAVEKISEIVTEESVSLLILGYVEGGIKRYFEDFARRFKEKNPKIDIIMRDETLTSRQAAETMLNINLPQQKRRAREHEIAAALILQSYLDDEGHK